MGVRLRDENPKQEKGEPKMELGVETQFSMFLEECDNENLYLYDVVKNDVSRDECAVLMHIL